MRVVSGVHELAGSAGRTVVALGNFDGVHIGHQAIIRTALERSGALGARSAVFTFWPHPQQVLRPGLGQELLCLREERVELIARQGVELLVEQPFDAEFASLKAERFFGELLVRGLGAVAVVVGYDFAFGRGRAGNLELLRRLCDGAGVELNVVEALQADGAPVSSSRIRKLLAAGEVAEAARLLGAPFFYRGTVVHGDGRGNKIGIPTANIPMPPKLRLPHGVYATLASVQGLREGIPAVTNVGVRPTFHAGGAAPGIETHFLDASVDVYGRVLTVEFVARIRDERRFSGVDELKARIAEDIAQARKILPN